jgi:hypothetical protein
MDVKRFVPPKILQKSLVLNTTEEETFDWPYNWRTKRNSYRIFNKSE